jgi:hypothetical protein
LREGVDIRLRQVSNLVMHTVNPGLIPASPIDTFEESDMHPLTHPLTGQPVALYDPALHTSPCWLAVRCGRCGIEYVCAPWADYNIPDEDLGWRGDPVCDQCLLELAHLMRTPR